MTATSQSAPHLRPLPLIAELLRPALAERPDDIALIGRGGAMTYAELDAAADAAAGALWSAGVRPGDRVLACLPNDLDVVVAFHGAQRIGAIWAGMGEALTEPEQRALVELCRPSLVLAGDRCAVEGGSVMDLARWRREVRAGATAPRVSLNPHAPAGIAFSSGTTGRPKAIVHSQHNLVLPAAVLVSTRAWGPDLRKGDSLPFTILNMLVLSTIVTSLARGCCVIMDRRDCDGIAAWIRREAVTVWNGVPAQLFDLARRADLDLGSLREVWSGGAACPEHVREQFASTHGLEVTTTYGLSEAPTVVAIDPVDAAHRMGASGRCLPHLDVAAFSDDGVLTGSAEPGELRLAPASAGPWRGMWRPPLGLWEGDRLVPWDEGRTVRTGDIGWVDDDGWLTMVDRKKLMIVRGGANISPTEVETVIGRHPGVEEVAVLGLPDPRLGARVAALVVARDRDLTAQSLTDFCSRRLAAYKVPEVWAHCDALPRNAMGKIVRTRLPEVFGAAPPM